MSFIYAEKYPDNDSGRELVRILCDTKISLDEYSSTNFSKATLDLVSKYGIVKSTICCPELCVSFAGNNIAYASKLFEKLFELKGFEPEDVADYALDIHNKGKINDIEFIITYVSNGKITIDYVKNGTIDKDVQVAHIGSEEAFRTFRKLRLSSGADPTTQTERAFHNVVNGCSDETVGGRAIEVVYNYSDNSFEYNWQRSYNTSKSQNIKSGDPIILYTSASDGGYSYEIVHADIENALFVIDQMEPAILYSRRYRVDSTDTNNKNLYGLMLPMLVKNDNGIIIRCR